MKKKLLFVGWNPNFFPSEYKKIEKSIENIFEVFYATDDIAALQEIANAGLKTRKAIDVLIFEGNSLSEESIKNNILFFASAYNAKAKAINLADKKSHNANFFQAKSWEEVISFLSI